MRTVHFVRLPHDRIGRETAPLAASTASNRLNRNKALLREKVLEMRANGMSYLQIAEAVGLHWTRVGQIVNSHQ
jgi:hypothetical protein